MKVLCSVLQKFEIFFHAIDAVQVSPDRTRWSGSTELMRVIGEAGIKYLSHFFQTDQFLCFKFTVVYGIVYTMRPDYATVLLIFDPIKCVKYLEAIY